MASEVAELRTHRRERFSVSLRDKEGKVWACVRSVVEGKRVRLEADITTFLGGSRQGISLTPDEAREIARDLTRAADCAKENA